MILAIGLLTLTAAMVTEFVQMKFDNYQKELRDIHDRRESKNSRG